MEPVYYAVPGKYLYVLTEEEAKEMLDRIKNKPKMSKGERKARRERVRAMYTKPGKGCIPMYKELGASQ